MEKYLDKVYRVYIDKFYTSLRLVRDLRLRNTFTGGTVRVDRGEFPTSFKIAKLNPVDSLFIQNNDIVAVHRKKTSCICHVVFPWKL